VKRLYIEVKRRDIFGVSTEELERGERPGWVERSIYIVEGNRINIFLDVKKDISPIRAYYMVSKIRLSKYVSKLKTFGRST